MTVADQVDMRRDGASTREPIFSYHVSIRGTTDSVEVQIPLRLISIVKELREKSEINSYPGGL